MLFSRSLLLLLLLCSFTSNVQASNTGNFKIHSDFLISPDTTSCPDDFLIDLGTGIILPYGDSIILPIASNRALDGDEIWLWSDPANLSCLDCLSPVYSPTERTLLTLSITDGDGCIASTEIPIEVYIPDDIFVPNAFSPNGDGKNDQFVIYTGRGIQQIIRIQIFSRKRDLVFERSNFFGNDAQSGWDGTFHGETLNPGVYVYLMKIELVNKSVQQLTGTINLIR